jgi:hypothetical protein
MKIYFETTSSKILTNLPVLLNPPVLPRQSFYDLLIAILMGFLKPLELTIFHRFGTTFFSSFRKLVYVLVRLEILSK